MADRGEVTVGFVRKSLFGEVVFGENAVLLPFQEDELLKSGGEIRFGCSDSYISLK